jgi:hypothetical protein
MKIDGKGPGVPSAERVSAPQARDAQETPSPALEVRPTDRVEISALGRSKSESAEESTGVSPVPARRADRLDAIRDRVRSGFYETDAVQFAVARQIVSRGDHRA